MAKNFTPIQDLINKYKKKSISYPSKEIEPPISSEKREAIENVERQEKKGGKHLATTKEIKIREETVKVPPELEKKGVTSTGHDMFNPYKMVKLPISDEDVLSGLHKPITSSWRWLSTLAMYIFNSFHIKLKKVHGKVVRIISNS